MFSHRHNVCCAIEMNTLFSFVQMVKWNAEFKQIAFHFNLNSYELLTRPHDTHRPTMNVQHNYFWESWTLSVGRCYAYELFDMCFTCVRVSVSFTSAVNYVGIHIAQPITVCSPVDVSRKNRLNVTESGQKADQHWHLPLSRHMIDAK